MKVKQVLSILATVFISMQASSMGLSQNNEQILQKFVETLQSELAGGALVSNFSEFHGNTNKDLYLFIQLSNGTELRLVSEMGGSLAETQYKQFQVSFSAPQVSDKSNSLCISYLLSTMPSRLVYVGMMLNKNTLFFGYEDRSNFAYDISQDKCSRSSQLK